MRRAEEPVGADARPLVMHLMYRFDTGGLENGVVNLINRLPARHFRHAVVALTEVNADFARRVRAPDVEFIRPCNLCPHMKRITLPKILDSLLTLRDEVTIDPAVAGKARAAVERMINLKS